MKDKVLDIVHRMDIDEKQGKFLYILILLRDKSVISYIEKFLKMDKKKIDSEMLDIIERIIVHAKSVYEQDKYNDAYDDLFYDKMLSKFKKFRPEPFGNNGLGAGLANAKYKYDVLSGTLNKTHYVHNSEKSDDRDSMEDFIKSLPIDKNDVITLFVNHKEDGTSVTIDYKYKDGYYVGKSAISRGKKDYGEGTDVSAVIPDVKFESRLIENLLGYCPKYIGVQYEFLVSNQSKEVLEKFLNLKFSNCRSAAAGLLRRIIFADKEERNKLKKFMSLVPVGFDVLDLYKSKKYNKLKWSQLYEVICQTFIYGNIDMEYCYVSGNKKELLKKFEEVAKKNIKNRKKLNHAIDGLVCTIDDKDLQKKLGRKNNINKWQIAYKFPEEEIKTVVRGVEITTGNFGYKEMLLLVDPVILNGTNQSKAQVHSLNKFRKMNPRIGDEIILKLSGDVIPYGYKDSSCRKGDGPKIKFPTHCECGAPLIEEKNKLRCSNSECPSRVIGSLVTFFTELNAKGIGEKTCSQLYHELGIRKPSEILSLSKADFESLNGFKDASAGLCMNTVNDIINKPRSVASILSSLGIDSFRTSTAVKLLDVVSIETIIDLINRDDQQSLIKVIRKSDGIDANAEIIAKGLIDKIDELKRLLNIMTIKETSNIKYEKNIVVSGLRNDEELTEVANQNGYNVKDSGKKFDLLIIKDSSYMDKSKAKYALSKDIPIMTRNEFIMKYKN